MDEEGFAEGNADELFRLRDQIADADPDLVLVMSADHVYRLDYRDVIDTHRERGGRGHRGHHRARPVARTPATTRRRGRPTGRVTSFAYKPDKPSSTTVATEVFVYDPTCSSRSSRSCTTSSRAGSDEGDTGLGDFGDLLLPRFVERAEGSPTGSRATGATSASRTTT